MTVDPYRKNLDALAGKVAEASKDSAAALAVSHANVRLFNIVRQDIVDHRRAANARFDRVDRRFDSVDTQLAGVHMRIDVFAEETRAEFRALRKRLGDHDKRLEQVDKRFEGMDKRFDSVDDQLAEIKKLIQDKK
jgi:uncharacterized protein YdcH (DUF465 family)